MGGGGEGSDVGSSSDPNSPPEAFDEPKDSRYAAKPRAKRVSRFDKQKPNEEEKGAKGSGGKINNTNKKGGQGSRSDVGATGLLERPDNNDNNNNQPTKSGRDGTMKNINQDDVLPRATPEPKLADTKDIERLRKTMGQ